MSKINEYNFNNNSLTLNALCSMFFVLCSMLNAQCSIGIIPSSHFLHHLAYFTLPPQAPKEA
jgi:hypothetical protein